MSRVVETARVANKGRFAPAGGEQFNDEQAASKPVTNGHAMTADELVARICRDDHANLGDLFASLNKGKGSSQGELRNSANAASSAHTQSSNKGQASTAAQDTSSHPRKRVNSRSRESYRHPGVTSAPETAPETARSHRPAREGEQPEAVFGPKVVSLPNVEAGGRPPKAPPKHMKPRARVQVNFRADPEVKAALRYLWYERGLTMADACNEAIRAQFPEAFVGESVGEPNDKGAQPPDKRTQKE